MALRTSSESFWNRPLLRYPRTSSPARLLHKIKIWQAITGLGTLVALLAGGAELHERIQNARAADLSGKWALYLKLNKADMAKYKGMLLKFSLHLKQDKGGSLKGAGELLQENQADVAYRGRRPITVEGKIDGDTVVMTFLFSGETRPTNGTIRLRKNGDGRDINGTFEWDASQSLGEATIRRIVTPPQ